MRENMARDEIVSQYLSDLYDSFTYTDEEKDAYYQENAASYDQVEYAYAYLSGSADEEAGIDQETAMATAAGNAQTILDTWDGGDLEAFQAAVEEVTGGAPTETSLAQSSFLSQFDGSVTQEDLADGYVFSHESSAAWYVVYVQGVQTCDYPTVNVRHILVKVEDTDGDGTYSDEEKQAAYDEIVALRDEWLAGDPTEDSFSALQRLRARIRPRPLRAVYTKTSTGERWWRNLTPSALPATNRGTMTLYTGRVRLTPDTTWCTLWEKGNCTAGSWRIPLFGRRTTRRPARP